VGRAGNFTCSRPGCPRLKEKASAQGPAGHKVVLFLYDPTVFFSHLQRGNSKCFPVDRGHHTSRRGQTLRSTNFRLFFRRPRPDPRPSAIKRRKSRHFSRFIHRRPAERRPPPASATFSAFKPITSRPQFIPMMILPSWTPRTFIQHFVHHGSAPFFVPLAAHRLSMSGRHFLDYGQLQSNST